MFVHVLIFFMILKCRRMLHALHAAARFGITRPDYPPFGNIYKYKLLTASYVRCVCVQHVMTCCVFTQ